MTKICVICEGVVPLLKRKNGTINYDRKTCSDECHKALQVQNAKRNAKNRKETPDPYYRPKYNSSSTRVTASRTTAYNRTREHNNNDKYREAKVKVQEFELNMA